MPFRSEAQKRFLFANKPKLAKEFASETPKGADLPQRVAKSTKMSAFRRKRAVKVILRKEGN